MPSRFDNGSLIVATYNIHRAIGSDGRQDLDRVAQVIRQLEADVVGLQEVDSNVHSQGAVDQLAYLADVTGMDFVAGGAWVRDYGDYGNGLLTSCRVIERCCHTLPVVSDEPRSVLEARLETRLGSVTVINTHFGTQNAERQKQHERLLSVIDDTVCEPLIVMGDFNDWSFSSRACRSLDELLGRTPRARSFPARLPLFALDRIWSRAPARVVCATAVRTRLSRAASDHLPVRARIVLD